MNLWLGYRNALDRTASVVEDYERNPGNPEEHRKAIERYFYNVGCLCTSPPDPKEEPLPVLLESRIPSSIRALLSDPADGPNVTEEALLASKEKISVLRTQWHQANDLVDAKSRAIEKTYGSADTTALFKERDELCDKSNQACFQTEKAIAEFGKQVTGARVLAIKLTDKIVPAIPLGAAKRPRYPTHNELMSYFSKLGVARS